MKEEEKTRPEREIRAHHDGKTIRVYQAYSHQIADAALGAGRFCSPFKMERMTWIKPSFLWMAYRAGWGHKDEGQARILAIDLTREGFEAALGMSCLSHSAGSGLSHEAWEALKAQSPVRIQWDPERDLRHAPLPHRSIQIGLSGPAVRAYVEEWTAAISDVTAEMHAIGALVAEGRLEAATERLPRERPYPLPPALAARVAPSEGAPA